jgi:hypothetical protein
MNLPICIERDVPLPESKKQYKYPFAEMQIGDSFAIPLSGEIGRHGEDLSASRLRSSASTFGRVHGGRFIVRIDKVGGSIRCWKVE